MKLIKYPAVLVLLLFAVVSNSNAQASVKFLGGGTPALFQELGAASQSIPGISCIWTSLPTSNIAAADLRWFAPLAPLYDQGSIFVAWGPGTGTCASPAGAFDVYSYMQLDSVVAMKCYFMSGTGCTQILSVPAGTAGANLMKLTSVTDTPIPAAVINAISNQNFFAAGTDIRPEDAKFAIDRMLRPVLNPPMGPGSCGQLLPRQVSNQDSYFTFGMGYNYLHSFRYEPHYGGTVCGVAALGGGTVSVPDFEIAGPDPVSGTAPSYTVSTIGAKPILVAVAPNTDTTGIGAASDINSFTLALFYQGVLARTTDLIGPTAANPVNVFVPDPLAGDYNVFEYSVPQRNAVSRLPGLSKLRQLLRIGTAGSTELSKRQRPGQRLSSAGDRGQHGHLS